jgi:hypothetical protein
LFLGFLWIVPEIGILGFEFFFLKLNQFSIVVKDVSSAHPGAPEDLLSGL